MLKKKILMNAVLCFFCTSFHTSFSKSDNACKTSPTVIATVNVTNHNQSYTYTAQFVGTQSSAPNGKHAQYVVTTNTPGGSVAFTITGLQPNNNDNICNAICLVVSGNKTQQTYGGGGSPVANTQTSNPINGMGNWFQTTPNGSPLTPGVVMTCNCC
jgi:hypothetical protein